ncbi:hypothetical protein G4B88_000729 [Cannabis sativa]|uniref:Uncharacterized protein n=1 Tax=Cannabis sativa TaxID=3483 RepID=A0A7J6I3Q1_CANSA|nr:hypothetical protein G4B88_000729 [Cannabis sativa]
MVDTIVDEIISSRSLIVDDDDYDDDFSLWGQSIGGEPQPEHDLVEVDAEPEPEPQPKKKGRGAYKGKKHIKDRSKGKKRKSISTNGANYMKPGDWKAFDTSRLTLEWEKARAKVQGVRAKNQYNHHGGRGGVKKVEEDMERELGHQLTTYDRCDLWIKLHTNKRGELDGSAQEVAKRTVKSQYMEKRRSTVT